MESLKRICEGFVYAGWNVHAQETPDIESNKWQCYVCRRECCKNLVNIIVSINGREWRFNRIHIECLPWTGQDRARWIAQPDDPLAQYRGLTMICRAFALGGHVVYLRRYVRPPIWPCFICRKPLDEECISFAMSEVVICAQVHEACLIPFKAERDRVIMAYDRANAWKIWAVSFLGDCRYVIGGFLAQLPKHEDVFNLMFPSFLG